MKAPAGKKVLKILKIGGSAFALLIIAVFGWGVLDTDEMLRHIPDKGNFEGVIRLRGFNKSWAGLKDTRLVKMILRKNNLPENITEKKMFFGWTTDDIIGVFGKDLLYILSGDDEVFLLKIGPLTKLAEALSGYSPRIKVEKIEGLAVKVLLDGKARPKFFYKRLGRTVLFSESPEALIRICRTRSKEEAASKILASIKEKDFGGFFPAGKGAAEFLARTGIAEDAQTAFLKEFSSISLTGTFDREIRGSMHAVVSDRLIQRYPFTLPWKETSFENLGFVPEDCIFSASFDGAAPLTESVKLAVKSRRFRSSFPDIEEALTGLLDFEEVLKKTIKDEATLNISSLRKSSDKVTPSVGAVIEGNLEGLMKMLAFYFTISNESGRLAKENYAGRYIHYFEGESLNDFFFCTADGRSLLANNIEDMKATIDAMDKKQTLVNLKNVENLRRKGNVLIYLNCRRLDEEYDIIEEYLRQTGLLEGAVSGDELEKIREEISSIGFAAVNGRIEKNLLTLECAFDLR